MGFTMDRARSEYELAVSFCQEERLDRVEWDTDPPKWPEMFSFDELVPHLISVRPDKLSVEVDIDRPDPLRVLPDALMQRLPWYDGSFGGRDFDEGSIFSMASGAEYLLGGFDPYTALRLLAEAPENLDCDVTWHFGPLVEAGWAAADEFVHGLSDAASFLIVTEGSSDAKILRHAISLLRPEISDFFRYIDMEDGYPFSGTGNMVKFLQGLTALRTPIKVVAVFDNDAEGVSAQERAVRMRLRDSYRTCRLPDHPSFELFPTIGPTGFIDADINGRAAAIECYLDLTRLPRPAVIEWGGLNREAARYQGALLGKTAYMDDFLSYKGKADRRGDYDLTKMSAVMEALVACCVDIMQERGAKLLAARRRRRW